jgi:hypothetical protein
MWFASASDNPLVYEVTPEGTLEDDPDHKGTGVSFACPKAKIIAIYNVPDYVVLRNRRQMYAIANPPKRNEGP